jgi:hypothetical protein
MYMCLEHKERPVDRDAAFGASWTTVGPARPGSGAGAQARLYRDLRRLLDATGNVLLPAESTGLPKDSVANVMSLRRARRGELGPGLHLALVPSNGIPRQPQREATAFSHDTLDGDVPAQKPGETA